jgi:hypothetical protein
MLEEMIKELDAKVEFLIDKNIQYCREIERLRELLDEANSKVFVSGKSDKTFLDELKPVADRILARMEKIEKGNEE